METQLYDVFTRVCSACSEAMEDKGKPSSQANKRSDHAENQDERQREDALPQLGVDHISEGDWSATTSARDDGKGTQTPWKNTCLGVGGAKARRSRLRFLST
jgi:hypothetical protein